MNGIMNAPPETVIARGDAGYPTRLDDLRRPPQQLYALGNIELLAVRPAVAIVGTRACTQYGEGVAREIAGALARGGACVVSGLARGIDAAAHVGALEWSGATIGVLGTGVDVPYPATNRALHSRIAAEGLLLSELPPGSRAGPGSFPRRNRIIAALADVTIVVEAGHRSGAQITAGHALELGRTLAAVPGRIDSRASAGSNHLLRDGAHVIASIADAVALAGLTPPTMRPAPDATGDELLVWKALSDGPLDAESLAVSTGLTASRCMAAITALEIGGSLEVGLTGEISRR